MTLLIFSGTIAETTDEMIAVISVEMIVEMIARVEEWVVVTIGDQDPVGHPLVNSGRIRIDAPNNPGMTPHLNGMEVVAGVKNKRVTKGGRLSSVKTLIATLKI